MKKIFVIALAALMTVTASAQKLGRVNFTELVQLAPEADAAREQITAMQNEAQETYASMLEEYQTKANQYQQKSASWTAAIRESKEKELYDIQNRLQEFQQTISQELQQQQNTLMSPIMEKAQEVVKKLAKAQGLAAVFDDSSALYFDETAVVDLTPAARKELGIKDGRTLEQLQQEMQAQAQAQAQAGQGQ
ncbi:MAG: OmpH family outer membrane protein [Bacteroidales bacterium]|nr:OmpH family outer membrane protein [Bacteroidales bacterium]